MKKLIFCFSLICTWLFTACVDKDYEVDEESKPSWLGESIYEELKNPDQEKLTGTFSTFLRLVDDLGYADVLGRTGSKTVFPANDEAFERFFSGENNFGVRSYEELSTAQKKMLLYNSMLDNPILTGMLSKVSNTGGELVNGAALKHATTLSAIDTIQTILHPSEMYPNNDYWKYYDSKSINVVGTGDISSTYLVHFTRDFMLSNSVTTVGAGSDFSILTGEEYDGSSTYIFRNKVINADVTCQNGYIHQVQDVIDPPGNMAQVLKRTDETSLFSRMLDRFAFPVYSSSATKDYLDWAELYGVAFRPDSIFAVKYISDNSNYIFSNSTTTPRLPFDPGWNQYILSTGSNYNDAVTDFAVMFVPDDDAVKDFFLNGSGKSILDEYGTKKTQDIPVSEANLIENIDMIPVGTAQEILSNLMRESFVSTVPSKFSTIMDDVGEVMGMSLDYIKKSADGSYDIKIANNGVIYVLNEMIAPTQYQSVWAPAQIKKEGDLQVVYWIISNKSGTSPSLNLDYWAYLNTMSSNFALFLPDNTAFNNNEYVYVSPPSLGEGNTPIAIKFYPIEKTPGLEGTMYDYNIATGTIGAERGKLDLTTDQARTALTDIINYHTVVLNSDDNKLSTLAENNFYKTRHGGMIKVNGATKGTTVSGGFSVGGNTKQTTLTDVQVARNGTSYMVDRLIQGPVQSVHSVLANNDQFSEFLKLCMGFENTDLMDWAGISSEPDPETKVVPANAYIVFSSNSNKCLDYNVNFFNTYNYTVYAPDNTAMDAAYAKGLPTWNDLIQMMDNGGDPAAAKEKIDAMRDFARAHFQQSSVCADKVINSSNYTTFVTDDLGINQTVSVSGGNGTLTVTDFMGVAHNIVANEHGESVDGKVVNCLTRDFVFDSDRSTAKSITTSSFAVVHQISEAFHINAADDYSLGFVANGN